MTETKEPAGGGLGTSTFVGVLACLAAAAYISYQRQDLVAAGAAGAVAAGVTLGYWRGAVGFLALAAGAAGGYAFAPTVDGFLGPILDSPLGSAGVTSPAVRMAACGLITAGVIQFAVLILGRSYVRANPSLKSLNGILGMGLGGTQAAAAVLLFLCGILAIEPQRSPIFPGAGPVTATTQLETLAFRTRQSAIMPYLAQYDPFQRFPQLRQALDSARQSQQPPAIVMPPSHFNAAQVPGLFRREPSRGW